MSGKPDINLFWIILWPLKRHNAVKECLYDVKILCKIHCNSLTFPCTLSHLGCLGNVEFKATILASDKTDTFGFRHGKGLGLCIIFYGRRILTKNLQKSFFFSFSLDTFSLFYPFFCQKHYWLGNIGEKRNKTRMPGFSFPCPREFWPMGMWIPFLEV